MYILAPSSSVVKVMSRSESMDVGSGVPIDSSIFREGSVKSTEARRIVTTDRWVRRGVMYKRAYPGSIVNGQRSTLMHVRNERGCGTTKMTKIS